MLQVHYIILLRPRLLYYIENNIILYYIILKIRLYYRMILCYIRGLFYFIRCYPPKGLRRESERYVCIRMYVYIYTHICMRMCIYIYICLCKKYVLKRKKKKKKEIYIYIYIYLCIHAPPKGLHRGVPAEGGEAPRAPKACTKKF